MSDMTIDTVISLSGGIGSWFAARRWVEREGAGGAVALFADTLIEDEDLYRFLDDIEPTLDMPLIRIAEGRTPWEVFEDQRMIGNTRIDLCSRILKREMISRWVGEHCDGPVTMVVGIDFTEEHRLPAIKRNWAQTGHAVEAPLCWRPEALKDDAVAALFDLGIKVPRLYEMGFPHNNCGGFCVKAGQAQFVNLLRRMPNRYRRHEESEERMRLLIEKDVSILRDRRGGETKPMTMRAFRERVEADPQAFDKDDWGSACNCFAPQLPFGQTENQEATDD